MDKARTLAHEDSMACDDGSLFVLFSPVKVPAYDSPLTLKISVFAEGISRHAEGPMRYLPPAEKAIIQTAFNRSEILSRRLRFMGTNGRGSLMRANVSWGELRSRYDAALAANMNPMMPEDRWIMLSRCRAWLVFQGYSQEICDDCIDGFYFDYGSCGTWKYRVPCGQGEHICFFIEMAMGAEENEIQITFSRHLSEGLAGLLADQKPVRLIVRPDMENRNCHDVTKAYEGPENSWQKAIRSTDNGFIFSPSPDHMMGINAFPGSFVWEPEWHYMVHRSEDEERGQDPNSDLFSPGYFFSELNGGDTFTVNARILSPLEQEYPVQMNKVTPAGPSAPSDLPLGKNLEQALDHFIVKRGDLKTVIAGYPWFLDWGRDSMIFTRGLIAAGRTADARAILKLFGQFEQDGTLPNVIYGENAANRDTSDAPLWFCVAVNDMLAFEATHAFLDEPCAQRTIRQILESIGNAIIHGTPGNVRMDPESNLVFSPCHFSWMDTNHPAGSPREGYPIEIQALWYHYLTLMARISSLPSRENWQNMAKKVKRSITDLFLLETEAYLSDCLHGGPGVPAAKAEQDDALRPNQLLAITLDALTDRTIAKRVVEACQELLVPGAIRSLADRPVRRPLEVVHNGNRLNDPHRPYQGTYTGDEDFGRKPAYHNGTAWTWIFPSFCEAWVTVFGAQGADTAMAWLASSMSIINTGCIGQVPEILDGDFPHRQRGCDAQAWGISELLRVWKKLANLSPHQT